MKVTFILTDFPAYSQTFVLQQIKNIIEAGHDIKILANYNPGQKIVQPIYLKYKLYEKTYYYDDNIYDPSSNLNKLSQLIDKNTDLFHCHFFPTGVALINVFDKLNIDKPVLVSGYGIDIMAESIKNKYSNLNCPNVSFIAVSDAIKQKMIYLGIMPEKIWIVPLTVDSEYFKKINKVKKGLTSFTSICRLVEKKGIDTAIKSFYTLKNVHSQSSFRYDIYGDGPEFEKLSKLIDKLELKKEVKLHSPVDHKKILSLFKKTDFLIQTSKTAKNGDGEGLPTVILEAQSSGIPVIGTYHSGIPEEVINNVTGFLSDERDIRGITENIRKAVLMDNLKYQRMSLKARKLMVDKFNDKTVNTIMTNIYTERVNQVNMINIKAENETKLSRINEIKKATKLLIFSHTSGLGGSERSLLEMIVELQELGVICKVVLPNYGSLCDELEKRGVDYQIIEYYWWCSLEKITKRQQVEKMNSSFINLLVSKDSLDSWNPDIIFTNTLTIPWGGIYSLMAKKPHMTFIREFGNKDFNFDFYYGFEESIEFINEYSDFVFTNSKATLNHVDKYLDKGKSDYAYAYINIDKKLLKEKVKRIFRRDSSLKLAIMGAIIPSKGQEEAVKAAAFLIKKGLDVELAVIGSKHEPKFTSKLEKIINEAYAKSKIRFHDFVTNPYAYMKQADILIVSSKNEAYGRVTIEAMSLGKPVIGTNSGATLEIIEDKETGLLYPPGDHNELAKKIEFIYNNRREVNRLGKKALQRYKKMFSKNIYGKKIYAILKKIQGSQTKKNALNEFFKDFSESTVNELIKREQIITELKNTRAQLTSENENLNLTLARIYSSKTWKILHMYKNIASYLRHMLLGR